MSFAAVLSPMPGTPGRLSDVSPLSATKSVHCSGVTPYFSTTRSRVVAADVGDPAARHHHADAVADELEHVPVAGDDDDLVALRSRLLRERREEVVGLVALELDDRDAHRLEHLADERELLAELSGVSRRLALYSA